MSESMNEVVPLRANQVRAYVNKQNKTSYYIVLEDGVLWFREDVGAPLHLSKSDFRGRTTDVVVLNNINELRNHFDKQLGIKRDK